MTSNAEIAEFFSSAIGHFYQPASPHIGRLLDDDTSGGLELLDLEVAGAISFVENGSKPTDINERLLRLEAGASFMKRLLDEYDEPLELRQFLLYLELRRVWIVQRLKEALGED